MCGFPLYVCSGAIYKSAEGYLIGEQKDNVKMIMEISPPDSGSRELQILLTHLAEVSSKSKARKKTLSHGESHRGFQSHAQSLAAMHSEQLWVL